MMIASTPSHAWVAGKLELIVQHPQTVPRGTPICLFPEGQYIQDLFTWPPAASSKPVLRDPGSPRKTPEQGVIFFGVIDLSH